MVSVAYALPASPDRNRERIVKQAGDQLFQKRPDIVSPNAYGQEMTATLSRDMDYYLRLVTYGIVAGDVTPIEVESWCP